jgi:ABC-2 type transport system ATP-binding protein
MDRWWDTWAPYWEHMEDRHFGTRTLERLLPRIAGPVLVLGAGLGLLVERLRKSGFVAHGVDRSPAMVGAALRVRGLQLTLADAAELPFRDESYRTVILSSGVLDYLEDDAAAGPLVREALRVLAPGGRLFAGFYRIEPAIDRVYRRLGVVAGSVYHPRRMFDIEDAIRVHPLRPVKMIVDWTGRGYGPTLLYWFRMGLARPRALRAEQRKMQALFEPAARDGVERRTLVDAFPDRVPYRNEAEVVRLLDAAGLPGAEIVRFPDCLVACRRKPVRIAGTSAAAAGEWLVRVERVSLRYPGATRDAVHALDLEIPRGGVFGILGPNGAGKTTTMSLLAGLLVPREGAIRFAGKPDARARRRTMGTVPQHLALCPRLTARENLEFFGGLYGLAGRERDARVAEMLELAGLSEHAAARIETFSSGMLRRLNLAAGLVHHPDVLLLDEPTVGIDPQSRNRIFDLVLAQRKRGRTVLLTTQYLEEASRLCDRVVIMDDGVVLVEGAPGEIVARTGTFRLEFQLETPSAGFVETLRGLELAAGVGLSDGVLSITARDGAAAMRLLEQLPALARTAGVRLALRRVAEPSLESVFLDLTGRSIRDTEAA